MIDTLVLVPVVQASFFSGPELIIVLLIVLLLFGGKKLPEVARSMGSAMRAFKEESSKIQREITLEDSGSSSTQAHASAAPTRAKEAPIDLTPETKGEAKQP